MTVGLMTDTRLVRNPQRILDRVRFELDNLLRICAVSVTSG